MFADAIESDGIFAGKIKYYPILEIYRKSPEVAQLSVKFVSLKTGIKRVFAKNFFFLFGHILDFRG